MKRMKAVALLFCVFLAGCNTLEGLGEDTEEAGEEIQQQSNGN